MKKTKLSFQRNKRIIYLDTYAGEWVAIASGKVVAHQSTLKKLMRKVEKLNNKPSILLVPKRSEGPYL